MKREAIGTGKTVEEALENAYQELGVSSDTADFEILERPKKSLFGLRVTPAKVRVYVDEDEPERPYAKPMEMPAKPQAAARPAPMQPKAAEPVKPAAPKAEPAAAPVKPKETRTEAAVPAAPKAKAVPSEPVEAKRNPQPAAKVESAPKAKEAEPKAEAAEEKRCDPAVCKAKVECAQAYLKEIFEKMGLEQVEIAAELKEDAVIFTLSGDGLGVLIGRRGETLDALQYLAGLVANRIEGGYFRVTIDSGNYREKREKTLEQLARKLALQVVKTGRNLTLEPMNPYERRIIHSTVQTIDGVTSSSIGEEPNRRVVISSTAPKKKMPPRQAPRGRGGKPRPAGAAAEGKPEAREAGNRPAPRGGKPPYGGNRRGPGPSSITTKPNAFGNAGTGQPAAKRIDDSAYEIEPPVRKMPAQPVASKPAPKAETPAEAKDKPLYSKIDID